MSFSDEFVVSIARTESEIRMAQALRYEVFVEEMGSDGPMVDHKKKLEIDRFDPFFDHMLVTDLAKGQVVGVYRLLRDDQAQEAGQFYSEDEYDLGVLKRSGRKLLELGRSCLHPDYRGGAAMFHLWNGLADYVQEHGIEVLFGVASFPGTDIGSTAASLSLLYHNHLAPEDLRTVSKTYQSMELIHRDSLDRRAAMVQIPALIKAYLRLGGYVGDGAFLDHQFNTTDVCLILDTARMNERQRRIYGGTRG